MKFPSKIGPCIDLAYKLRADRLVFQAKMEDELGKFKAKEQAIEDHIINTFTNEQIGKAGGKIATASVVPTTYPVVKDWTAFYAYIHKHKAYDLLEKRPARVAYRERLDLGTKVDGVEPFIRKTLSLTKISK